MMLSNPSWGLMGKGAQVHFNLGRRPVLKGLAASLATCGSRAADASAQQPVLEHLFFFGSVGTGEGQFGYVEDFAFMPDGRLLVTDASHAWVQVFDAANGRFLTRFGGKGGEEENLEKPEGIAVDAAGNVFVADYTTGLIQVYDPGFRWVSSFAGYGSEPGRLSKPEFMTIAGGRLYIPEADNHRVSVFDLSGEFQFAFGRKGEAPGELNNPEAIKLGPDGRMYLSDLKNDRVQVFGADGVPLAHWGSTGTNAGELRSPAGVAVDQACRVWVTEIGNDRIQVFDRDGQSLGVAGKRGSGPGEFLNLHGIASHPRTGLIYVADTGNNRVQVFRTALRN